MKTIINVALILLSFGQAYAQNYPPSDNDLRTAYCIPIIKSYLAVATSALGQVSPSYIPPPDSGTPSHAELAALQDQMSATLSRLQAYLLPKLFQLDPTGIAAANSRAQADIRTMDSYLNQCAKECGTEAFKVLQNRMNACKNPTWLPF